MPNAKNYSLLTFIDSYYDLNVIIKLLFIKYHAAKYI